MKPKRIISLLLAICLVAGLMPTAAFAAGTDTGKAIQLGTSGISDPTSTQNSSGTYYTPSDYVYFGVKDSDPIKWRVLDADQTNDGTTSGMFLLSEYLLDRGVVFESALNSDDNDGQTNPNEWQHSDAQNWCSTFAANPDVFSTAEQAAFLGVTKNDTESSLYALPWGASSLTENDKVFFLSVRELADYVGSYDGAPGLKATDTAQSVGVWWLRSPYALDLDTISAGAVGITGYVYDNNVTYDLAARPAFNLNLNSVLFTSAAVGGKTDSAVDSSLTTVADYAGNGWKLTLLDDEHKDFEISNATKNSSGGTIAFSYSGAQTGTNEYISVVIEDSGAITHYGRILQPESASGTASLTLPDGVTLGENTKLYVFNEQYNGDYMTDYASPLKEISPTVDITAPTLTAGTATRDSATTATVKFTSDEAGEYFYEVVESGTTAPTINTAGTGTSCASGKNTISLTSLSDAGAKDIYIVAKDAVGNVSSSLKIEIHTYIAPVYAISADTQLLDFGTVTEGYTQAPAAKTVTITNTGNQDVTVDLPTSTNYTVTAGTGFTNGKAALSSGGKAQFTVQPKTGLTAGSHSETLTISGSGNASVQVALSFTVNTGGTSGGSTGGSTTDYYRLTFDTNGGSEIASILRAEYTTVDLSGYTPTREGYEFTGWYADEDLTDKITSIRLTRNTTIYAGWK